MTVIGVAGHINAGKDVIASYLHQAHGYHVHRFANQLKIEIKHRFPKTTLEAIKLVALTDKEWVKRLPRGMQIPLEGWLRRVQAGEEFTLVPTAWAELIKRAIWTDRPPIFRAWLQEHGTELRRADDPDYWTKALWNRIDAEALDSGAFRGAYEYKVVIPDTRFPNELESIKARSGLVIRVDRPGVQYYGDGHISEHALEGYEYDAYFVNDGTVVDLQTKVAKWLIEKKLA